MRTALSDKTRRAVAERARHRCEYCLLHEEDGFYEYHIDHIISVKHGGTNALDNLAYTCSFCNYHKGTDVGSILWETGEFVRFFNPRRDLWSDHFRLEGAHIEPLTDIGRATARIFGFNTLARIQEREALIATGRYPPSAENQLMP
jgi:hypothetical protein